MSAALVQMSMTIWVLFLHKFLEEHFVMDYNEFYWGLDPYTLPIASPNALHAI
jgi:hypothetical protein